MAEAASGSVDVVVATRNRPVQLGWLLEDLRIQSLAPTRVVLVDDSTEEVDWSARYPPDTLRVIRPKQRLMYTAAKNVGARGGISEFIAFVDDDNRVPPDLLSTLVADLAQNPSWGAVMPAVLYHLQPELVWVYATPFGRNRWSFDLVGRNRLRDRAIEGQILPTDALPNLSVVRRTAFDSIGGFDEWMQVGSSADFAQRLKSAGWEVVADTAVLTRHDVDPPGVPGHWAEHTVADPVRAQFDIADWFRFQRRWNHVGPFFAARATLHALGFLLPQLVGIALRSDAPRFRLLAALVAGCRDGLVTDDPGPPSKDVSMGPPPPADPLP